MANMVNNLGTTEQTLPVTIGNTIEFGTEPSTDTIGIISGELGLGFELFDTVGTFAVCTLVKADEENNPVYVFTTKSISSEPYIQGLLAGNY